MRNIVASIPLRTDFGLEVKTDGEGKNICLCGRQSNSLKAAAWPSGPFTNAALNKTATGIEALSTPKKQSRLPAPVCRAVEQATGWKLRGEDGYKPDNAGQHSRLAYAQAGGIIFEPFLSPTTRIWRCGSSENGRSAAPCNRHCRGFNHENHF